VDALAKSFGCVSVFLLVSSMVSTLSLACNLGDRSNSGDLVELLAKSIEIT